MKTLIIILLITLPLFSFAQNSIQDNQNSVDLPPKQKNTVLSFLPLSFGTIGGDKAAILIGVSYERFLKKKPKLALQIPLQGGIGQAKGFTIAPTIKFYPFGNNRVINWSIGPSLRYAFLGSTSTYYDNNIKKYISYEKKPESFLGFELQNTINIIVDNMYFSISNSLGINYISPEGYPTGNVLIGAGLGYKF